MAFYVSLFLVSLIVAALCIWFYRFVVQASRTTYRTILPSSNDNVSLSAMGGVSQSRRGQRSETTPWGWGKQKGNADRVSVAVPVHNRADRASVGWPYRNEPFSFDNPADGAGSKTTKSRKTPKGSSGKPWGW